MAVVAAVFLYLSVPLFDQDLMAFPYFKISLIAGLIALLFSEIMAISGGRISVDSQLAEERQQRAISEISQVAVSGASLMELLNFTLDRIVAMLQMSGGVIHVYHRARQNLVLGSFKGLSARVVRRLETIDLGDTAIGKTARNQRLLIIRNLRLSPDYEIFGGRSEGFSYMALIPIISEGEHWGVITLFGKGGYRPGQLQVDLLEQFGEQLGAALVLGRQMRAAQSSLESMKGLIISLGDELYAGSKLRDAGLGAVRAIAWSLTRILSGDRFDLCRNTDSGWITALSSEPGADNQPLTSDPESEFIDKSRPSGMIGWDQAPPFKEFMERRPYIFSSMPDQRTWMFIRLESRRRVTFDFDFFYNACRIIYGLSQMIAGRDIAGTSLRKPFADARSKEKPGIPLIDNSVGELAGAFGRIFHDLEKLIEEYSSSGVDDKIRELIAWLEVIGKTASDGKETIESIMAGEQKEDLEKSPDDLHKAVLKVIEQISSTAEQIINIEVTTNNKSVTLKYPLDKLSGILTKFLAMAVGTAADNGALKLTTDRQGESIIFRLAGRKLPAHRGPRPKWLSEVGATLEFASEKTDDGVSVDCWKLAIPDRTPAAKPAGASRVLAVDTRDIIRDLLAGMLAQLGYESVIAGSSREAIHIFEQAIVSGNKFDIVIADNAIDELSGLRLASRMKEIDPEIFFLLTPGWGMEPDPVLAEKSGVDLILEKPFRLEQLSEAIRGAEKGTADG